MKTRGRTDDGKQTVAVRGWRFHGDQAQRMTKQTGPRRRKRDYPHGSGDRNSWSPTGGQRMPIHEGGTQRDAPAAPDADGQPDPDGRRKMPRD